MLDVKRPHGRHPDRTPPHVHFHIARKETDYDRIFPVAFDLLA